MKIILTIKDFQEARKHWQGQVGFVPTMGYLHDGHLSLIKQARSENNLVVVSIFVNPKQFGPREDLNSYPRNLKRDLDLLQEAGVDVVFTPTAEEMYSPHFASSVEIKGPLTEAAEGASRPGHFSGVCTVVLKLFQIVQPHVAYFGQKDAQQVAVISRMVSDFALPLQLSIQPIYREHDGLAMSSRNSYLDAHKRTAATILYRALKAGLATFQEGESPRLVEQAMKNLISQEPLATSGYALVFNPQTFTPLETLQAPALLLVAVHIGSVRLIDNFYLHEDGTWETGIFTAETSPSRKVIS